MPTGHTEYARLPVTDTVDLTSEEEDDLYTRPPRRHKAKLPAHGKPSLQVAPNSFREAATRPVKRYQLLDEEDALGVLQAASPGVRVRSSGGGRKKACLLITCLLLLTGCSVGVWMIPCRWYGCIGGPMTIQQSSVHHDYETMFPDIVLTTRVVVVPTVYLDSTDLVFGYRNLEAAGGGVMVVDASSGAKLWKQQLYEAPVDLQCGGVDLNGNGIFECLATGSSKMMVLVNMDRHEVEWYLHLHNSTTRPVSLLPPLLVSDLTQDGVADLLVAGLVGRHTQPRSQLMIADGATGMILAKGEMELCPVLLSMTPEDGAADVTLECMSPLAGVSPRTVSLTSLTSTIRTSSMPDTVFSYVKAPTAQNALYQVQVENSGVCPSCRGRLTLLDLSGSVVWSITANRSRLHSVQQFNHRNHSGVAYKLWEYSDTPNEADLRRERRWEPSPEDLNVPTLVFEEEASVTQAADGYHFKYRHNSEDGGTTPGLPTTPADDGSTPEYFVEAVYVVAPGSDGSLQAQRVDSVQMTRFCLGQACLPAALPDNTPSVEILDVGSDLDLDMVTVTSLYVPEGDVVVARHKYECTLQTRVRKVQLYGPHWRETVASEDIAEQ